MIKWDAKSDNFDPIDTMEAYRNPSCVMTISQDGSQIAVGSTDGHVIGINAHAMSQYRVEKKHKLPVESITFNDSNSHILTASLDYCYDWTPNSAQTSITGLFIKL